MGTREPSPTWAALTEAPEHPAPMIALTPSPLNASRVRCIAADSAEGVGDTIALVVDLTKCLVDAHPWRPFQRGEVGFLRTKHGKQDAKLHYTWWREEMVSDGAARCSGAVHRTPVCGPRVHQFSAVQQVVVEHMILGEAIDRRECTREKSLAGPVHAPETVGWQWGGTVDRKSVAMHVTVVLEVDLLGRIQPTPHRITATAFATRTRIGSRVFQPIGPALEEWPAKNMAQCAVAGCRLQLVGLLLYKLNRGRGDTRREARSQRYGTLCCTGPRLIITHPRLRETLIDEFTVNRSPVEHGRGEHRITHKLAHI
eukprot:6304995-Prymnesium_polylepis.2